MTEQKRQDEHSGSPACSPPFVVEFLEKKNGPYHWEWAADSLERDRAMEIIKLKRKAFPNTKFRLVEVID